MKKKFKISYIILGVLILLFLWAAIDGEYDAALVPFLVLCIWGVCRSAKANSYMKKNGPKAVDLNYDMNHAYDLREYYKKQDTLTAQLETMAGIEKRVSKKYRLSERPSVLLVQLTAGEDDRVSNALYRMYLSYKQIIKEQGIACSEEFQTQADEFKDRMCKHNVTMAKVWIDSLKRFEIVAGEIEETDHMDGHSFEYWCADLLKKNGFKDVEVTPGSGDQGVDITAEKDQVRYAIQCKCYSSDLGNKPVQEVFAGKEMYQCQVAVVMTNRHFTAGAHELAEKTRVLLWGRDELSQMLASAQTIE